MSRIQTGNRELHREAFDFDKAIHEAVENTQSATKTHRIFIRGKATNSYAGDESHIIQVINNLLSNAIKYAPESGEVDLYLSRVSNFLKCL